MVEPSDKPATAAQRLGAPDSYGVSTLEPGLQPPTAQPSGGRQVPIRVQLLDDTQEVFQISQRSPGKFLFDLVAAHLNLVWLDLLKPTLKQIRRPKNTILRFVVKFFPPDHTQLIEELTSAALMVSHVIQSEIGDFDETQSWQHLLHNKYLPDQDALRDKITDCHRKHAGQTPAESDYQLLEIARRLEMYGIRLHPAKDREGTKLSLSGYTKINAFNWSKIRKLSFKRKRFLIKLRATPSQQSTHHDTLEFSMASRDCCKVFWKKQIIDYVKDSEIKKIPFERKHSKILSSSSMTSSFRSQMDSSGADHRGNPTDPETPEPHAAVINASTTRMASLASDLARSRPNHQHQDSGSGAYSGSRPAPPQPRFSQQAHKAAPLPSLTSIAAT
ncbi:hypothetical protein CRUP_003243 [Coryphaenoides rupestris]|nr:hypothetical protein CRUP_003243 [Coryphaenoides rupestris]